MERGNFMNASAQPSVGCAAAAPGRRSLIRHTRRSACASDRALPETPVRSWGETLQMLAREKFWTNPRGLADGNYPERSTTQHS